MTTKKISCIDDIGYVAAAKDQALSITNEALAWVAIQSALLLAQRTSSGAISDMQESIANRRMVLAEEMLTHAKLTWAKEKEFVDEMMAAPLNTAQYNGAQVMLNEADRVEGIALTAVDDRLSRFGITVGVCDDARTRRGMATARTDLVSHSMRSSEARTIALNDRRYSRQLAATAMGRGVLQNAASLGQLSAGQGVVRDSLIRTINSGMSLWGYSANRWSHGGNYITGRNGAPTVVPQGHTLVQTGDTAYLRNDRLADALERFAETSPTVSSAAPTEGGV